MKQLLSYPCPSCSAQDWKTKQEKITRSHAVCKNCGFDPLEAPVLHPNEEDLNRLITQLRAVQEEKETALVAAREKYETNKDSPDAVILFARVAKAERECALADRRFLILDTLIEVVGLANAEGMITLHVPEVGLFVQFNWGGYDLLKGLERVRNDAVEGKGVRSVS